MKARLEARKREVSASVRGASFATASRYRSGRLLWQSYQDRKGANSVSRKNCKRGCKRVLQPPPFLARRVFRILRNKRPKIIRNITTTASIFNLNLSKEVNVAQNFLVFCVENFRSSSVQEYKISFNDTKKYMTNRIEDSLRKYG
jgi:hypothetical protein